MLIQSQFVKEILPLTAPNYFFILRSNKSVIRVLISRIMNNKVTIKIPRPLYEKVQLLINGSGFNSPTDFIVYVLRDLVGEKSFNKDKEELTPEELQAIKRRLRNLGYLD